MIVPERPSEIAPEDCPSCGTEMLFSGTQPAGLAQFFCEPCQYRHDRFVGAEVVAGSTARRRGQPSDD
ncbi:HVO_2142 family zinc finger protein [Salinigranum halophilum]|uniref:HVO_2142 family zinc finger protein n=1 Tax=Salinigranum halophilum TaxID=2565931 RepID=UPI0026E5220D|nr:HVO_2142 family zinc finger protein [Salinigranum halophilum]